MKSWLHVNDVEMYSTPEEVKSDAAERFIRTLKNKIYKYMTLVWKNVYIDKLDDIVYKDNNRYHSPVKMKLFDVKPSMYVNILKNNEEPCKNIKI